MFVQLQSDAMSIPSIIENEKGTCFEADDQHDLVSFLQALCNSGGGFWLRWLETGRRKQFSFPAIIDGWIN